MHSVMDTNSEVLLCDARTVQIASLDMHRPSVMPFGAAIGVFRACWGGSHGRCPGVENQSKSIVWRTLEMVQRVLWAVATRRRPTAPCKLRNMHEKWPICGPKAGENECLPNCLRTVKAPVVL